MILGIVLMIFGCIAAVACTLWLYIEIFRSGILWGLLSLFIPIVGLVWLVTHLEDGWKPLLGSLAGIGLTYYAQTLMV